MSSKTLERGRSLAQQAWEGARVEHVPTGRTGEVVNRWTESGADVEDCRVAFDDATGEARGRETAPIVLWSELRPAAMSCGYDVGKGRAELARRKTFASATCGRAFRPSRLVEPREAICPSCSKIVRALNDRWTRVHRRRYLASVRAARRAMPRLYAELKRIDRAKRVFYLIPHVARSGMSRRIELFYPEKGGGVDVVWPDYEPGEGATARELETLRRRICWNRERCCFVVGGCGMDMVFWLVDHLGHAFGFENWGNKIHRSGLSRAE